MSLSGPYRLASSVAVLLASPKLGAVKRTFLLCSKGTLSLCRVMEEWGGGMRCEEWGDSAGRAATGGGTKWQHSFPGVFEPLRDRRTSRRSASNRVWGLQRGQTARTLPPTLSTDASPRRRSGWGTTSIWRSDGGSTGGRRAEWGMGATIPLGC